jgi:O-antigen ligase
MIGAQPSVGPAVPLRGARALLQAAGLIALALAVTFVLQQTQPPFALALAAGAALLATLALALARYDLAAGLGFLLLVVVRIEPAPPDLVFIVVIAVALLTGQFRLRRSSLAVGVVLAVFLALNVISTAEAIDAGAAVRFFAISAYLVVFALWLTAYVDCAWRARLIVRALVVAAVASAVFSTLALFVRFPGSTLLLDDFGARARGLFKDPNVFGPFLVPVALILLEEILTPRLLRVSRWVKSALFALVLLGVLFSFSRGAWLNLAVATVVMLLVLALRRGGGRNASILLAVVIIATVAVLGAVAFSGTGDFLEQRARTQAYDVERFRAQRIGIDLAAEEPLGIGPGQFELRVGASAHSTFVRVLAEQGLLGLIIIVTLMFGTLVLAAGNAARGRSTYGIGSAALLGAWCGILVSSVFVDTLHWRHAWLVAALVLAGTMRRAASVPRPSRPASSAGLRPRGLARSAT